MSDADATPHRMDGLATLPVFFKLQGRRVVVAGGDPPAVWKAELIAAAGAQVLVFAEEPCPAMIALEGAVGGGTVRLVHRGWTAADLDGAALAVGSLHDDESAAGLRQAAKNAGVPVNVIDRPVFCDFQFGTVVSRSPLVIGISTDGAAPVFGQAIRTRIEALLPPGLRRWAEAAKAWRAGLQDRELDFRARRRFWEVFAERALLAADRAPDAADRAACLAAALEGGSPTGRLSFVGAGSGDPGSLTLAGVGVLQSADIVIYEADVATETIAMARREATKIARGQDPTPPSLAPLLAEGRHVAWLGPGNPLRCSRWRELAAVLSSHRPELVPGLEACPRCPERCRELEDRGTGP